MTNISSKAQNTSLKNALSWALFQAQMVSAERALLDSTAFESGLKSPDTCLECEIHCVDFIVNSLEIPTQ